MEDDFAVRSLLPGNLGCQPEFDGVLVAGSVEAFLHLLPEVAGKQLLVLLAIGLPGLSGIGVRPPLRRHLLRPNFVMQTVFESADRIYQALCAGATGYLLKSTLSAKLNAVMLDVARSGGRPNNTP